MRIIRDGLIELDYLPFDAHVHFRDAGSDIFKAVVPYTARQCWGAVVMPNTNPFILTPQRAIDYSLAIKKVAGNDFCTVMTGYLTSHTSRKDIQLGFKSGAWSAMKAYPKGLTTNSHGGIEDIFRQCHEQLQLMEDLGMPLLLHGEKASRDINVYGQQKKVDIYDRSRAFVEDILGELVVRYPKLRISLEHISSRADVEFLRKHGGERLVCTVTPQHALLDRNDFFAEGPDVHLHCYPVLKRAEDREAVASLATSGLPFVFAGTDSAPHPTTAKERACGCAGGVFTAHKMVELYTEIFARAGKLPYLEAFLGIYGPLFYDVTPRRAVMQLERDRMMPRYVEGIIEAGPHKIRPFGFHDNIEKAWPFQWRIAE